MKLFACLTMCLILAISLAAQNKDPNELPTEFNKPTSDKPANDKTNEMPQLEPGKDIGKAVEDALPPALSEEKSKQISRYFEEALKNYEEILSQEKSSEVKTTDKRIESNMKLLDEYNQKLSVSETGLRKIKLEYVRRFLILKNAHTTGRIDKKTYEAELEKLAREYQFKINTVASDAGFYKGEVKKTSEILKELQEAQRINKIFLAKEESEKPVQAAPQRKLTQLEKLVAGFRQSGCFEVRNYCASLEFK